MEFKKKFDFNTRLNESTKIREKFPNRIPVICEKIKNVKDLPDIDKNKYLVPTDLTVGQFMYVIRKRLKMPAEAALFLFVHGNIPPSSELMFSLYEEMKDTDGFLYVHYSKENTFG